MDGPSDFLNIGGEEYLTSKNNVTIIEWGDLLKDLLPSRTITVNFTRITSPKDSRNIKISGIKLIAYIYYVNRNLFFNLWGFNYF